MVEAEGVTETIVNGLVPGHVFKLLERDRRNYKADRDTYLISSRRTLEFFASSKIERRYHMPRSEHTHGNDENALVLRLL